jgi:PAS domain S-box-containing protein
MSPIRDETGVVIGTSKICRELRDRKEAAMAVRHLGAIIASSDDVIIGKDLNGIVQSWNPAAERLLGFTAEEMVGQSIRRIIPAERQKEEDEVLARVRAGMIVDHFETVRQAKDGTLVEVSLTVSPIRDRTGRIVGASKIARDIGAQKRAAAAALHLAALVQSSDDVIVSKDLNGIVRSWNPAAERLFGYSEAEMIGQSITRIVPLDRIDEEAYVLGRIRAGLSVEHFETIRQTKDGRLVDISLTVSPIRDAQGRVIGASKIARDIREHKRLLDESRIAAANEEAARRQVLEVQNRRIQEGARLKSEFVANMSHELRTPLNSIVGFAELMADARFGPLPEKYAQFARVMHSSAQHLLQLINDILDLAKVESGKIDFQAEPVDLPHLISETTSIVAGLATARHIPISVDVSPDIGLVHLDSMRSNRCCTTTCPTPSSSPPKADAWRSASSRKTADGSASRWRTRASASGRKTSIASSSSSSSSMRARARSSPGPASASRSRSGSSRRREERSACTASSARGARSSPRCRGMSRRRRPTSRAWSRRSHELSSDRR